MMKPTAYAVKVRLLSFIFFILIAVLGSPVISESTTMIVNIADGEALVKSIDYAFHQNYDEAEKVIREYIDKHPERPEGYFFMAATYFEYTNALRDESKKGLFKKYAKLCVKKAKLLIKNNKNDAAGYFYMGAIAGYKGLVKAREQKLISAFRQAVISKKNLERALKLDPELYDSYFGLGTLYYFASKKHVEEGGLVGWIIKKFITKNRDMRDEAIKMINMAIERGRMTSQLAYSALMWIMMSEEEYVIAYDMAKEVMKNFPEDKHGYWVLARIEMIHGKCESAAQNFNRIVELIENKNLPLSSFEDVKTGQLLAETCVNVNRWELRKITSAIRSIRISLVNYENIIIEYQNAKQVVRDWKKMLHDLERQSIRIRRLSYRLHTESSSDILLQNMLSSTL